MRRRHRALLPILVAAPLTMGSTAVTFGSIALSDVHGDPLVANQKQNLVFTINHQGDARNIFDFVFEISESKTVLFQAKQSFFKVPNGFYKVNVTVPWQVLKEDVALVFTARCERYYSADAYVCYSSKTFTQIPRKIGQIYRSDPESKYYTIYGPYYPSVKTFWRSSFTFCNVQKKRDVNSRRLHLEDVMFGVMNMDGYKQVNEQLGELRIYTKLNYWNIGERSIFGPYISLPLGYSYEQGTYSLRLFDTYSFSKETGEMMELTSGYPRTNDLILPYWATESNPIKIQIALLDFNLAGQSFLIDKEVYRDGNGPLDSYYIWWEEN